jgi:hypothetical protein
MLINTIFVKEMLAAWNRIKCYINNYISLLKMKVILSVLDEFDVNLDTLWQDHINCEW